MYGWLPAQNCLPFPAHPAANTGAACVSDSSLRPAEWAALQCIQNKGGFALQQASLRQKLCMPLLFQFLTTWDRHPGPPEAVIQGENQPSLGA